MSFAQKFAQTTLKAKSPDVAITWNTPAIIPNSDSTATPEAVTLSPPYIAKFSSALYACFRERDDSLWISSTLNGKDWNQGSYKIQKAALPKGVFSYFSSSSRIDNNIYSLYRPSIAPLDTYLYLSWNNKSDNTIGLARTTDPTPPLQKLGSSWSVLSSVSTPTTPGSGPSIAGFNSRLYLAYRDADSNIYIGSLGSTWSSFQAVQDSSSLNYQSQDGPTLLAVTTGSLTSRLWISFRQLNTFYFGYASFDTDGYSISSWTMTSITTPCNLVEMPVVSLYGSTLYAAYQGSDQKICYGASTNGGSSWGDWGSIDGNLVVGAPSMAQIGTVLSMVFQAFSLDTGKKFLMATYHDFA